MNNYEKLLNNANEEKLTIIEKYDFSNTRIKGLYCDGTVALDKNIKIQTDRACVLAEELGHYHTTVGDILDQSITDNRKQEHRARVWAYNKLIGLSGIVKLHQNHIQTVHEAAEYLDITEEFFYEALQYYKSKYGKCTTLDNYVIYFDPAIAVFELI